MNYLWVFGYGSLMWRPGFPYVEARPARMLGVHRALCVYSWVHRGTPERPGLVLGLDRGGTCRGMAFRVAPEDREEVVAYLRAREQVTGVYLEQVRDVRFEDGGTAPALTYVVDRAHEQYAGKLDVHDQLRIVAQAQGQSGRNAEYVINTALHLAAIGVPDRLLSALAERLGAEEHLDADQAASETAGPGARS